MMLVVILMIVTFLLGVCAGGILLALVAIHFDKKEREDGRKKKD